MSEMGMFNHVPKPDEVAAKAFSMSRDEQEQWSWPSYCCGLSDGGVCDARVTEIMLAAMNGEFSHNTEQAFSGELSPMHDHIEQLEAENAKLRELVRHWYPHMRRRVGIDALRQWGCIDDMRELGIEVEDD